MASSTSSRLWRTFKAAGRPFPQLVEDDVLDYLLVEAVALKVNTEDAQRAKEAQNKAEVETKRKEALAKLNRLR